MRGEAWRTLLRQVEDYMLGVACRDQGVLLGLVRVHLSNLGHSNCDVNSIVGLDPANVVPDRPTTGRRQGKPPVANTAAGVRLVLAPPPPPVESELPEDPAAGPSRTTATGVFPWLHEITFCRRGS